MSTSNNRLVKTLSEINPEGLPTFSSLDDNVATNSMSYRSSGSSGSSGSSFFDFFTNITWQTWLIIILILAFLGINIFSYLETGTKETVSVFGGIFDNFFAPILQLLGYQTLETTKQVVQTSATGTKAGVDIVADTTTTAIDTIETTASKNASKTNMNSGSNSGTNTTVVGKDASSSLSMNNSQPVQNKIQIEKQINELEDWQQNNLQKALDDSSRPQEVRPDDSLSRIQKTAGKSGWCFIGEDRGFRTCSQVGENDQCMSGDVFPSQEICMNPNLRA